MNQLHMSRSRRRRWTLDQDRVRVYEVVRSAHLERAETSTPAELLYRKRRYDFDPTLAGNATARQVSIVDLAIILVTNRINALEINEPLQVSGLPVAAVAIAAARLGGAIRRQQPTIGTYAIENRDPFATRLPRLRSRMRKLLERRAAEWVTSQTDRIVFGTPGSAQLYEERLGVRLEHSRTEVVPALPSACPCLGVDPDREPGSVLFVGALQDRKGIRQLLQIWRVMEHLKPDARLMIIGKGDLEQEVREFAADHASVEFVRDPPRSRIHEELRRHAVVVLLSQRSPNWREQVGLPIVEGLSHGCRIVTTAETGLAAWLADHGHFVVDTSTTPDQTASAIVQALRSAGSADVLAALPSKDGRLAADERILCGGWASQAASCERFSSTLSRAGVELPSGR